MEKEDRDLNKIFAIKDKRQTIPFRSKDLANFLEESGELSLEICKVLEANDIDGETFLNLMRTDFMDLFSFDFKSRKQVADCVEFMKLNGIQVSKSLKDQGLKDKSKSISKSPSEASTESVGSTNPDSEETEVDIIPSSQQFPFVPKRKRSFDSEDTELIIPTSQQFPVVQKRKMYFDLEDKDFDVATQQPSLISKHKRSIDLKDANVDVKPTGRLLGFQFPITNKVKKCIKGGTALKDEDRRQLIRECVTCLQAKVGEVISNPDFKEASKIICEQIPVLKDAQPPHWPTDMEFPYWSSVLYLLKKRYLNLKSRKPAASTTSHETPKAGLEVEDKDLEDMNKESGEIFKYVEASKSLPNTEYLLFES